MSITTVTKQNIFISHYYAYFGILIKYKHKARYNRYDQYGVKIWFWEKTNKKAKKNNNRTRLRDLYNNSGLLFILWHCCALVVNFLLWWKIQYAITVLNKTLYYIDDIFLLGWGLPITIETFVHQLIVSDSTTRIGSPRPAQ